MWLIERSIHAKLLQAEQMAGGVSSFSRNFDMQIAGGVASIPIKGVLTKEPYFFAYYIGAGNTTYADIIAAISAAEANPEIEKIELRIDSPGGSIAGLFACCEAIRATSKPVVAIIEDQAASAAFILASQADERTALNVASKVGSFGVVVTMYNDDYEIDITNRDSALKRPDISTEEGRGQVQDFLDSVHGVFVETVAEGMGIESEGLSDRFGNGAMFIAADALSRGMIDSISDTASMSAAAEPPQAKEKNTGGNKGMTLDELKAQHPEVFQAVVNLGVAQEKERVSAHLHMGKNHGPKAMDIAVEAIEAGSNVGDNLIMARYLSAGINATEQGDRQGETEEVPNVGAAASELDEEDQVYAEMQRLQGIGGGLIDG